MARNDTYQRYQKPKTLVSIQTYSLATIYQTGSAICKIMARKLSNLRKGWNRILKKEYPWIVSYDLI